MKENIGTWIHGVGSTSDLDSSGERIEIKGIDISSLMLDGVINFEHKNDNATQIVGKVLEAKKILEKKDCENKAHEYFWEKVGKKPYLYIAAVLFDGQGHSGAKDAVAMMNFDKLTDKEQTRHTIGFSIEGSRLEKDGSVIKKCVARKITITNLPCNKMCIAEIMDDPTISSGYKLINKDKLKDIVKKCEDLESDLKKSDKYMRSLSFRAKKPIEPKKDYTKISSTHGESKPGQEIKPKRTIPASSISNTDKLKTGDRISYSNKIKGRSGASIYKDPKTWEKKDKFMSNVRKAITASCGTGSSPSAKVGGEALSREKVMKSLSEEAWKNFENKEELIEFLNEKTPDFNEKEILAFAKTYAYVDMKKKEMVLNDLAPMQKQDSEDLEKASKPIHEMTRKEYENTYGKPRKNTTVTGGFHPHKEAVEIAINQGKPVRDEVLDDYPHLKNAKKTDVAKGDIYSAILGDAIRGGSTGKSEHGVPGKNRPLHEKGVNPTVSVGRDVKDGKMVGHYKEQSLQGIRTRRGDVEGAKRAAKEIISEQKQMPKPNLPKSEKLKDEKGVHNPAFDKDTGVSTAGAELKIYSKSPMSNWSNKEKAKESHKKVISEQKEMPRPNLPKSEQDFASKPGAYDAKMRQPSMPKTSAQMDKPKMPTMKSEGRRSSDVYGVHAPRSSSKPGESEAGHAARGAAKIKGEKGDFLREKAKYTHEKKIKEQKEIEMPNLPKSEKAISKADEFYRQKGVHKPYLEDRGQSKSKMGTSEAGWRTKLGSKLNSRRTEDGEYLTDSDRKKKFKQKAIESAKIKHKQVISEQKQMKKPNLPKSEKDSVEDVKIDLKKD